MTERLLDEAAVSRAVAELAARDRSMARLAARNGIPPLWLRPAAFATMVLFILEQQVSLASARAAFAKLEEQLSGNVTAAGFLSLDDAELRACGFSRQKAGYARGIARRVANGDLDFAEVALLPAEVARRRLLELRGVGPWTADVFLCMVAGAPDAWPSGDRALQVSMGRALGIPTPDREEADRLAERWRPYRAAAARLLWHDYLGGPGAAG